jgi:SAM-dependent methyltransferase
MAHNVKGHNAVSETIKNMTDERIEQSDVVPNVIRRLPPVLDACCGGRMMWFNKSNPLAIFMDKRRERVVWDDRSGNSSLEINPDVLGDFTDMPFPDNSFALVVFDPPHMATLGKNSKMANIYGRLFGDWTVDMSAGFRECFRVLKPSGVLIFKWNETDIPLKDVIACSPIEPLFGHKSKRHGKTHWICFIKAANGE